MRRDFFAAPSTFETGSLALKTSARLRIYLFAVAATAAGTASAETSPYYIGVSQAFGYESNLLRLGNDQVAPAGYSKSDSYSATSLLAGLNQPIGRQRVFGTLSVRHTRYRDNSLFNNTGYALNGGVDWSTINRISGTLSASANRSLSSFGLTEIGLLTRKNLESSEAINSSLAVGLVTEYSFEGAVGYRRVRNSLDESNIKSRDYDQSTVSGGIHWRPSDATNLGLGLSGSKGRYPSFNRNPDGSFDEDRFTRQNIDFTAILTPRGVSTYDARISIGKTRYDLNQQRDFSGVTGTIGWLWATTAKLHFTTRLTRDTGQDSYAVMIFNTDGVAQYSQTVNSLRVQADYDYSAKIAVTSALQYAERKLVNTIQNPFIPINATGSDRTLLFTVGARWAPLRNALLGCDLGVENRNASGQLSVDLKNNSVSCYGQLTLQ